MPLCLTRVPPFALLMLGFTLSACQPGYESQKLPILGLEHAGEPLEVGEPLHLVLLPHEAEKGALVTRLALLNLGSSTLQLRDLRVEGAARGLFHVSMEEGALHMDPQAPARSVFLHYRVGVAEARPRSGTLVIETNETLGGGGRREVELRLSYPTPLLRVSPASLAFGQVSAGESAIRPLRLINVAKVPLTLRELSLRGDGGFSVAEGEDGLIDSADDGLNRLDPPLRIAPGTTRELQVRYAALGPGVARAELSFGVEGSTRALPVPLSANAALPCMEVSPGEIDFGGKALGSSGTVELEISPCSDEPLLITGASLEEDLDGAFTLEQTSLDDVPVALPLTLSGQQRMGLRIRFSPPSLSPRGQDGEELPFRARLALDSNAQPERRYVPLSGLGVEVECPSPHINIEEGSEVTPQTTLHLDGSASHGAAPITGYAWSVDQPAGAAGSFFPSSAVPNPQFSADVAGVYTFYLEVTDSLGADCGPRASATVSVVPDNALHIELLWSTPLAQGAGEGWGATGSDLDLHLVHPYASGIDVDGDGSRDGYFDDHYDCYWSNTSPSWEGGGADPRLDRDDTDGDGPENMNIDAPIDGYVYRVGVHYWADYDLGPSIATLRVYVYGELAYERSGVRLVEGDLWDALSVAWPGGEVTVEERSPGEALIHPMIAAEELVFP